MEEVKIIVPPEGEFAHFLFFIFLAASLAMLIYSGRIFYRSVREDFVHNLKKALQRFTLWLLGVIALLFMPVYLLAYQFGDGFAFLRAILLSAHNTMRLFILDGEFDIITESISKLNIFLRVPFSLYAALLYFAGPALFSFTIILSVVQGAFNRYRFHLCKDMNIYLFSCLNEESAAMAQSILEGEACKQSEGGTENVSAQKTGRKNKDKCLIIFCDLPQEEKEQEKLNTLLSALNTKYATVLSTEESISKFNVSRFHSEITFFLMDKNETKNIEDASALCDALTLRYQGEQASADTPARRVLVYASSAASGPLVDALSKKVTVPAATIERLQGMIQEAVEGQNGEDKQNLDAYDISAGIKTEELGFSAPFSIMRIDSEDQLAMRIVQDINDTPNYTTIKRETEEITVTLLGMGGIGKEMLKNILWSYQKYGCKLIVNVFDSTGPELGDDPDTAHNPLYDRLAYEWPELIETNRAWQTGEKEHPDTEASYDIRFFLGTDCFSKRFRDDFESSPYSERLMKSALVLCALGDDDKNLEAAMMIRQIFAGQAVAEKRVGKAPRPDIYAVVYDNQKSKNYTSQEKITNYKNQAYDIQVKGSMRSQYSFSGIKKMEEDEKNALVYHINWLWVKNEEVKSEKKAPASEQFKPSGTSGASKTSESLDPAEIDKQKKQKAQRMRNDLDREMNNYIHYEYFRRASLAKAAHKGSLEMRKVYPKEELQAVEKHEAESGTCRCLICQARITEHMRWNVFMRVNGYRYGKNRNDMGKIHDCLLAWKDLPPKERVKD